MISVDTKKKELIGDFKNGGREWAPAGEPVQVNTHDFPSPARGKAIPYGIYDLAHDEGWVSVWIDHDTAQFAAASIQGWWEHLGRERFPDATTLTITADCGGSNNYRTRLWKTELQKLADAAGLTLRVCQFPPGTGKWNKIEHRLFSFIRINWRGKPLTSHQTVIELIAATTTRAGLKVYARLDTNTYPDKVTITDAELSAVQIQGDPFHPEWNYTITPRPQFVTSLSTGHEIPFRDATFDLVIGNIVLQRMSPRHAMGARLWVARNRAPTTIGRPHCLSCTRTRDFAPHARTWLGRARAGRLASMPDHDLRVFGHIDSQTTDGDKRTLLALRDLAANNGPFAYLEIGSHLGGSLQPFVTDPRCTRIISIDPRPLSQPDKRLPAGQEHHYVDNSTDRMLSLLRAIPEGDVKKITTIDKGTEAIDPNSIPVEPTLCFIDGEHTDFAALRDAMFCAAVAPRSIIAFHDRGAVGRGIAAFMRVAGGYGHPVPDTIFVVDLGGRSRLDALQRRPWLWKAANTAGVASEGAALSPFAWSLVRRLRSSAVSR